MFVHRRHDDERDLYATLLKDVYHDVEVEPHLETLTGELLSNSANSSDEARLDFSARRFWQKGQKAFFDVRVFKPFAKGHLNRKLDTAFKSNENEKKRTYNQRVIEIEHGSFSPLVFTRYGGTGREAERFMTEQAQKLAERKNMTYNTIIHWLRSKLPFNLLKSAIMCLRGSRRSKFDLNMNFNEAEISKVVGNIKQTHFAFKSVIQFYPKPKVLDIYFRFYQQSVNSFYECILLNVTSFFFQSV